MPSPKEIAEETMARSLEAAHPEAAALFPHEQFKKVASSLMNGVGPFVDKHPRFDEIEAKVDALAEQLSGMTTQMTGLSKLLTAISGSLPTGSKK